MKTIKTIVRCRSYCDGALRNAWNENRTVYLFRDGSWVSHLGAKRGRRAVANGDGTYTVEYRIRSIPIYRV